MRYLSEIRDKDGHSLPFLVDKIENIGKYSFLFCDEETQKNVNDEETQKAVDDKELQELLDDEEQQEFLDIDLWDLRQIHNWGILRSYSLTSYPMPIPHSSSNCLGLTTFKQKEYVGAERKEIEYVAAAVHNENTVKLYSFIEFIGYNFSPVFVYDDSDICYEFICNKKVVSNTPSLTVELANNTNIIGECGSVVIRVFNGMYRICGEENMAYTLYDFLLNLCRVCMLNVMSYKTIHLVNTFNRRDIMTIKLAQTPEAKLFFNKMYERSKYSFIRYVSNIRVDGNYVDYATWPCASNMVVSTRNLDKKATEEVNDVPIGDSDFPINDCYGFSPRQRNGDYFIVRHTAPAAQLYKYIKSAKTCSGAPEATSYGDCRLHEQVSFKLPQDAATRTLQIGCWSTEIELYKPFGSVVYIKDRGDVAPKYLSLYDFLIFVCKSIHLNVMAYGTVQIYSDVGFDKTEIIFDHEVEGADRFFTKMYTLKGLE